MEHLVQFLTYCGIDKGVCIHESRIKITAEEKGIRRANILDDRIEEIESGQFAVRGSLLFVRHA